MGLFMTASATHSYGADHYLVAKEFTKTMPDGEQVRMWGFARDLDSDLATDNGEVPTSPGPLLNVPSGDSALRIFLRNDLAVPVSIVIPSHLGSLSPVKFTDSSGRTRVQSFAPETAPGATGTYSWNNFKNGSFIYQSGTFPSVQVPMGLYGGVTKDRSTGVAYTGQSYTNEVTLFYSEVDPALNAAVTGGTYGTQAYPSSMGYRPKYYLVNGEPFAGAQTTTDAGKINEKVLIRFFNAGLESHVPLLQGGYLKLIAEDAKAYTYPKEQYTVELGAGKTADAIFTTGTSGTYAVYDGRLFSGMKSFLKVVNDQNAPVAANDAYSTAEDTALLMSAPGVLSNDTTVPGATNSVSLDTNVSSGTLTLRSNGSFTYTPAQNFYGADLFRYRINSGTLQSDLATVQIQVTPVNDSPVAVNDTATTDQNVSTTVNVLANDTDVDGDAISVKTVSPGSNGTTAVNTDNTVMYTPANGFSGKDTFTYVVTDGNLDSSPATVTVTVVPAVNQLPVASNDSARTRRNTPVDINVLANDRDPDGALVPSSVSIVTQPTRGGTASVNANGTVRYTPRLNFRGTDVFTYNVKDDRGGVSNTATVRVNVVR